MDHSENCCPVSRLETTGKMVCLCGWCSRCRAGVLCLAAMGSECFGKRPIHTNRCRDDVVGLMNQLLVTAVLSVLLNLPQVASAACEYSKQVRFRCLCLQWSASEPLKYVLRVASAVVVGYRCLHHSSCIVVVCVRFTLMSRLFPWLDDQFLGHDVDVVHPCFRGVSSPSTICEIALKTLFVFEFSYFSVPAAVMFVTSQRTLLQLILRDHCVHLALKACPLGSCHRLVVLLFLLPRLPRPSWKLFTCHMNSNEYLHVYSCLRH